MRKVAATDAMPVGTCCNGSSALRGSYATCRFRMQPTRVASELDPSGYIDVAVDATVGRKVVGRYWVPQRPIKASGAQANP